MRVENLNKPIVRPALVILTVCALGCTGNIAVESDGSGSNPADNVRPDGTPVEPEREPTPPGTPTRPPEDVGYTEETMSGALDRPSPYTRAPRLTHLQLANTLRDLLYLDSAPTVTDELRADTLPYLFDNRGGELSVDDALFGGYDRLSASLAEQIATDAASLAKLGDVNNPEAFIGQFVTRAYRRALTPEDVTAHLALFAEGKNVYPEMNANAAGARLLIEAVLQAPFFLYRFELSETPDGEVIPLTDYELASRLSYMLWNSMPDETLMTAAKNGELRNVANAGAQATRMLEDTRATDTMDDFHRSLLELDAVPSIKPNQTAYPQVSGQFGSYAADETKMMINDVLLTQSLGLGELLSTTSSFVNPELANIYGVQHPGGSGFQKVDLGSDRPGLLTRTAFLGLNAGPSSGDPIHRGVFIVRRIACVALGDPPDVIPPLSSATGNTMREKVENLTEEPGTNCAGCHSTFINPYGFPFEHFDAIGAVRDSDNGYPIDSTSSVPLDGNQVAVTGAQDLIANLTTSPQVHDCYSSYWLEFAYGRGTTSNDTVIYERLGDASVKNEMNLKKMLVALVQSEAFMTRSVTELQ